MRLESPGSFGGPVVVQDLENNWVVPVGTVAYATCDRSDLSLGLSAMQDAHRYNSTTRDGDGFELFGFTVILHYQHATPLTPLGSPLDGGWLLVRYNGSLLLFRYDPIVTLSPGNSVR